MQTHKKNSPYRSMALTLLLSAVSVTAVSAELSIPHEFSSGTPAVAAEVNENFSATETAVNDIEGRLITLEAGLAGLMTQVGALEETGPALTVESHFATDLVFLNIEGDLSIPTGVDGNPSEPGIIGTGREWHALPGLSAVSFNVETDETVVLIQAEGEAYLPYWNYFSYFEVGVLVDGAGPALGASEGVTIVTDDNISSGRAKWHILHPALLSAGEHTFSVVVRVPHSGNEPGSIVLDGRSTGIHPGRIKATLLKIN